MEIQEDNLRGPAIAALLEEHLTHMHAITPPGSVHALDLDALRRDPEITFFSLRENAVLLGCGALKQLNALTGEIKSMRTAEPHRRRGVAAKILEHLILVASHRGLQTLFLETGSMPEFAAARSLYERHGFKYCPPFGDYSEDPNSVFMRLEL